MRLVLGLAFCLGAVLTASAEIVGNPMPCASPLTFRWTSGEPIRLDVVHPGPAALMNPPFLHPPDITSVLVGRNRMGPTLTITLGPAAAAVLAAETSTHGDAQMLIMAGDTVVIAARVMGSLSGSVVLNGVENVAELQRRADTLRRGLACHAEGSPVSGAQASRLNA